MRADAVVGAAILVRLEQVGDAGIAKRPVEREIARIVTPGTVTEEALLEERRDSLLMAAHRSGETIGIAVLDLPAALAPPGACSSMPLRPPPLAPPETPSPKHSASGR